MSYIPNKRYTPAEMLAINEATTLGDDDLLLVQKDGEAIVKPFKAKRLQKKTFVTVGFSDADYICDGTDDHVQIQAAYTASNGAPIFVKQGEYNVTSEIAIDGEITLIGEGKNLTRFNVTDVNMFSVANNSYIKMRDLRVHLTTDVKSKGMVLNEAEKTIGLDVRDCAFRSNVGVFRTNNGHVGAVPQGDSIFLRNVFEEYCIASSLEPYYSDGTALRYAAIIRLGKKPAQYKLIMQNNKFLKDGEYTSGINVRAFSFVGRGVETNGQGDNALVFGIVENNYVEESVGESGGDGFYISDYRYFDISGNTVKKSGRHGLSVLRGSWSTITNNKVNFWYEYPIRSVLMDGCHISNNICVNTNEAPTNIALVPFNSTRNCIITNNTFISNQPILSEFREATVSPQYASVGNILKDNHITPIGKTITFEVGSEDNFVVQENVDTRTKQGTAAPASTPTKVGDTFIDTTNGNIYIAKGTASSADWVQVNN